MLKKTLERRVLDVFEMCEKCEYDKGFQVSLIRRRADAGTTISRERLRLLLVCPQCGQHYDVGWAVELE
jgi:DNA-directed RNA polymerase subunit M/transcription elongation factor TFIIS